MVEGVFLAFNQFIIQCYPAMVILLQSEWPRIMVNSQGSHRLEKYLNLEGFLEKSLKIKSALKSNIMENHSKALKSP